jgi:hypothetical protein
MTPGESTELNVQDVHDGGLVKGPDPDQIVLEYKTISEDGNGKLIEEIVRSKWVLNPAPIDRTSPFHGHQEEIEAIISATLEVKT